MAILRYRRRLNNAFQAIESELDEHLETINANTEECYENRAMIFELQERLCKLSDAVSNLRLQLGRDGFVNNIKLDHDEQRVFLVLCLSPEPLFYEQLSRQLPYSIFQLQELVHSLALKGIPIVKHRTGREEVLVSISDDFKEAQSKKNIISIDDDIMKEHNRDFQLSLLE